MQSNCEWEKQAKHLIFNLYKIKVFEAVAIFSYPHLKRLQMHYNIGRWLTGHKESLT